MIRASAVAAFATLALAVAAHAEPAPKLSPAAVIAPAPWRAAARDFLRDLVAIDSTHAKGSLAAAEWMAAKARAGGIPTADVVVLAPPDHPTKANVLIRLRGKGRGAPLMIQGHLDVVEVDRAAWATDPFTLTEKEGWFYGRGVEDMKGDDVLALAALLRLKAEGFVPDRDILLAVTADEEAGGDANGPKWLFAAHPELMRAGLVLNVDDWTSPAVKDGRRVYATATTAEKLYVTFRLATANPGGHSSLPRPDNAINQMAAALGRIAAFRFPVRTTPTTRAFFAGEAALRMGAEAAELQAVSGPSPDLAAAERLAADPERNAQLRTTCVATEVRGGQGESALPNRAEATIQCRLLPGDTPEATRATLARVIADAGVTLTMDGPIDPSPETAPDPRVLARLKTVFDGVWPGLPLLPAMSVGASDLVYAREAGLPGYGVDVIAQGTSTAHGRDERIMVQAFDEGVEASYRLLKAMSAAN